MMLAYACVTLLIVAATCDPTAQTQNQLPRLLVTPNQLASAALLRLQQNPYIQPAQVLYNPNQPGALVVRNDFETLSDSFNQDPSAVDLKGETRNNEKLLLLPVNNQPHAGVSSRLQVNPSSQPGVLLYNPTQTGPLAVRGTVEHPIVRKGESDEKETTDRSSEESHQQNTGRQLGNAPIIVNPAQPRTFLRLQQTPSAQPGLLVSFPRPLGLQNDATRKSNDGTETSPEDNVEEITDKQRPVVRHDNQLPRTPSQVPFGTLIRLQQDPTQQPGVFLYNPTQTITSDNRDVKGEEEKTTEEEVNSKAEEVTEKNQKSQKLTGANGGNGEYYIYHPTGLLQKVTYSTKDDVEKMAFTASLKYKNVEPITQPIYTYDPKTFVFRRV